MSIRRWLEAKAVDTYCRCGALSGQLGPVSLLTPAQLILLCRTYFGVTLALALFCTFHYYSAVRQVQQERAEYVTTTKILASGPLPSAKILNFFYRLPSSSHVADVLTFSGNKLLERADKKFLCDAGAKL